MFFVEKPEFFKIFSASDTVLFLTSGTTIRLSDEELLEEFSLEGMPK